MLPKNADKIPNHTSHAWKDASYLLPIAEADQQELAMLLPEEFGGSPQANRKATAMNSTDGTYGSLYGAKTTVDAAYLIPRLGEKLTIHALHEVTFIFKNEDGYRVVVKDHQQKITKIFQTKYLILAAGMMNTIKILCENEAVGNLMSMPNLGEGFGTNGDLASEWEPGENHTISTQGLSCHGRLKIADQPEGVSQMIGGSEPFPYPWWVPSFLRKKTDELNKKYAVIAMSPDTAHGRVRFDNGRVKIDYSMDKEEIFTCHPLGGCRISATTDTGVVSSTGEIHNNPNLFITDASVFPAPTGGPPSLNIAVWSSYVAQELIKRIQKC